MKKRKKLPSEANSGRESHAREGNRSEQPGGCGPLGREGGKPTRGRKARRMRGAAIGAIGSGEANLAWRERSEGKVASRWTRTA
jgi:hypothetical protein